MKVGCDDGMLRVAKKVGIRWETNAFGKKEEMNGMGRRVIE